MIELRDYQKELSGKAVTLLREKGIAYLAMEVRTGKTLTALNAADSYGARNVLFITKKKAIKSIEDDYQLLKPSFALTVINYESIHKITANNFDLLICDEHHKNGAFPKPNGVSKELRSRFSLLPMIFLSGTPAIESGSQWYHQFWISSKTPFYNYSNFYRWADTFVNPKIRYLGTIQVKDYSDAKTDDILKKVDPYILKYTQVNAGFESGITENVLYCNMTSDTHNLITRLLNDRIIEGKADVILGDSAGKLMSKVHQLSNGTVILESGKSIIIDYSKGNFIKRYFEGKKIAIFYFFAKELDLLRDVFGDSLTTDLIEFDSTDKHIALQQVAGSEGISLKSADALVYYSWGYSGKNYVQGRDRMSTIDRQHNNVFFVMEEKDINARIYKVVKSKKRYSEKLFIKDYKL